MLIFGRVFLVLLFGAILGGIGIFLIGMRFGLEETYARSVVDVFLVLMGLAFLIPPLCVGDQSWRRRLGFAALGAVIGLGAGFQIGHLSATPDSAIVLGIVCLLSGSALGLWIGYLKKQPMLGATLGSTITLALVGVSLWINHPDPAGVLGLLGGLLIGLFLIRSETRHRLLTRSRWTVGGLFVIAAIGVLLLGRQLWTPMTLYEVQRGSFGLDACPPAFSPDGSKAVGVLGNGIYLWSVADGRILDFYRVREERTRVVFPDANHAYWVGINRDGRLSRLELFSGKIEIILPLGNRIFVDFDEYPIGTPFRFALSRDGQKAAVTCLKRKDQLWIVDFATQKSTPYQIDKLGAIADLAWINESELVLGSEDRDMLHHVRIEKNQASILRSTACPVDERDTLISSPNGKCLCLNHNSSPIPLLVKMDQFDRIIKVRRGRSWFPRSKWRDVETALFSADSQSLVWMDENGAVRFWSLAESREVKCFIQQRCLLLQWFTDIRPHVHVTQMALSPEGNKVLTATRRGKIRVWSAAR